MNLVRECTQIRTQRQWPGDDGGSQGTVHTQPGTVGVGQLGQGLDIGQAPFQLAHRGVAPACVQKEQRRQIVHPIGRKRRLPRVKQLVHRRAERRLDGTGDRIGHQGRMQRLRGHLPLGSGRR